MMNQLPLSVAVGSLNPVKVSSARLALERAGFDFALQGVEVPSGVAEQPIGLEEIARGARQRALNARAALGAAGSCCCRICKVCSFFAPQGEKRTYKSNIRSACARPTNKSEPQLGKYLC